MYAGGKGGDLTRGENDSGLVITASYENKHMMQLILSTNISGEGKQERKPHFQL